MRRNAILKLPLPRILAAVLCLCCLPGLAACGVQASAPPTDEETAQTAPVESPAQETPDVGAGAGAGTEGAPDSVQDLPGAGAVQKPELSSPPTDEEIITLYRYAVSALEPSVTLDAAGREWKYGAENDLKNLYYTLLSQHPELKYVYDMSAELSGDMAVCSFSYMPYKTGAYDETVPEGYEELASLHDAESLAQGMIGRAESLRIAITNSALEFDDLQRAVAQAGYGWIVFTLSRDGTEILAAPSRGYSLEECVDNINESKRIAGEILAQILSGGLSDMEKAEAAYSYITANVAYDFSYYSNRDDMPFTATVALGALRDNLAICGGYSHAFETMLGLCGIENYTVSGVAQGEYHAWNYVIIDGQGFYCDPTADRGGAMRHFMLTADELSALGGYTWDADFYDNLRG